MPNIWNALLDILAAMPEEALSEVNVLPSVAAGLLQAAPLHLCAYGAVLCAISLNGDGSTA